MPTRSIEIRMRVTLGQVGFLLMLLLLGLTARWTASESLTMSTTYPSPAGIYKKIITTADAYLATKGGKVGIGTSAPVNALTVSGTADVSTLVVGTVTAAAGKKLTVKGDANVNGTLSADNVQGATYAP